VIDLENDIIIEVWGDFACFTRPECKVERLTYPLPTPSAARGILNAIYSKPPEFFWQVKKIEVLNKIRYINIKRNEVKNKIGKNLDIIIADEASGGNYGRTQRQTVMLKDVRYRITAKIVKQPSANVTEKQLYDQALRRIRTGKCFYQPSLGLRECVAFFAESDFSRPPIDESLDIGLMLYDVFDLHDYTVRKRVKPYVTMFHAKLDRGVMIIPDYDSEQVLKPGGKHA